MFPRCTLIPRTHFDKNPDWVTELLHLCAWFFVELLADESNIKPSFLALCSIGDFMALFVFNFVRSCPLTLAVSLMTIHLQMFTSTTSRTIDEP